MSRRTVLVTGANGFVGRAACARLVASGWRVRGWVRTKHAAASLPTGVEGHVGRDVVSERWVDVLDGVDAVVHAAARVHQVRDGPKEAALYHATNVVATGALADACSAAGVARLVYLSSVKAVAEWTMPGRPLTDATLPAPGDASGRSKLGGEEEAVRAARGGTSVMVLRPPIVYGAGVRAHVERLIAAVERGVPLPLASVRNERSMIYVENLVSAIETALDAEARVAGRYFVADGSPVSTPDLIRLIAAARGRRTLLLPIPVALLRVAGRVTGRLSDVDRLLGSLAVDDGRFRAVTGWAPNISPGEAWRRTVGA